MCKFINKCQDPKYTIADATEHWMKLTLPCTDSTAIINARIQKAIYPAGYAAHILHPKYLGKALSSEQRMKGEDFLKAHLDAEGYEQYEIFKRDPNIFLKDYPTDSLECALAIWEYLTFTIPNLAEVALKLYVSLKQHYENNYDIFHDLNKLYN